jgi:hypothetical protein
MKTVVSCLVLLALVGTSLLRTRNGAHGIPSVPVDSLSFAKAITIKSPVLYPYSIAAGDLTRNGIPDLAVVGDETTALLHALGKGNGRFGPWSHDGGSGYAPGFVTVADLDLDGNLDALTNDYADPEVVISFGDGHGHFPRVKALSSGVGYATNYEAVADLNGDGVPDIVGTASVDGEDWGQIFVLLGKGHREFEKPFHFRSGGYEALAIVVADLNHDNIPDLVVVNNGKQPPYGNVSVLLGKGEELSPSPCPIAWVSTTILSAWRWGTSTAMGMSTWPSPLITAIRYISSWAKAMVRSGRRNLSSSIPPVRARL